MLPFLNAIFLPELVQLLVDLGPSEGPYYHLPAKQVSVNVLKISILGIVVGLIRDKHHRNVTLLVLFLEYFQEGCEPGVIVIVVLNFLGEFDDDFGDVTGVDCGFPAQKISQKYLRA